MRHTITITALLLSSITANAFWNDSPTAHYKDDQPKSEYYLWNIPGRIPEAEETAKGVKDSKAGGYCFPAKDD